ncbi:ABC transporter ATP-binding protein [Corynebacterium pygosceleis]|uniref:ABC transporter ATP-binding protein n=1 Tax=Corynebacterium pygosceleis TaxID=2800406 RepID=UPI001908A0CD|nr:ATP-binding cassette domain-containing protein [Corynebacterium pygosceleis]MCK7675886.1 ATP-binding cassette domain-containing protein [Corynebacterium pygosceleis]MCL0120732.1 ATP-binding cassette domain-containing protein [Corynebacterium pygosceleis]
MTHSPAPLVIDGISKRYGDLTALDGMSFTVHPGEIYGFVGSNGAGKSTTMRIALGVISADSGEVRLGGRPLTESSRRRIGYMPEERGLYPKERVGAQLTYLARLHGVDKRPATSRTSELLEQLGLSDRANDQLESLSLGNQQRVQLAAALVHDPDVLVLDEPFSGLDPVAVNVMSDMLVERAGAGVPVLFSSHQLDLVQRLCHRVGIVAAGRMRAEGTVDELRDTGEDTYEVHVDASGDWWGDLSGVRRVGGDGTVSLFTVDPGSPTTDQDILRTALGAGPVHHFTRRRPDLSDLFQEVVKP